MPERWCFEFSGRPSRRAICSSRFQGPYFIVYKFTDWVWEVQSTSSNPCIYSHRMRVEEHDAAPHIQNALAQFSCDLAPKPTVPCSDCHVVNPCNFAGCRLEETLGTYSHVVQVARSTALSCESSGFGLQSPPCRSHVARRSRTRKCLNSHSLRFIMVVGLPSLQVCEAQFLAQPAKLLQFGWSLQPET